MRAVRQEPATGHSVSSIADHRGGASSRHDGAELPGVRDSGNGFLLSSGRYSGHHLCRAGEWKIASGRFGGSASRFQQCENVVPDLAGIGTRDHGAVRDDDHAGDSDRLSSALRWEIARWWKSVRIADWWRRSRLLPRAW